jgi:hypothetical protein
MRERRQATLPHSTGVLFMRAVVLGAIAVVSAASQKCVALVGQHREQARTSCMLAIAGSQ